MSEPSMSNRGKVAALRRAGHERKADNLELRAMYGGDSQFMNAYQTKKIRTRAREIPAWTLDDKEVQKVLLRAFPKWHTNFRQSQQAGRWARIIHLYFRVQLSTTHVAFELRIKPKNVELMVAGIRRVARGRRADNKGPRGVRRPGRPKVQTVEKKSLKAIMVMHEGVQTSFNSVRRLIPHLSGEE